MVTDRGYGERKSCDNPCPVILSYGIGLTGRGVFQSQYWLEDDGMATKVKSNGKPTYLIPSMEEIKAIEWNGLNVASTFSGCGGSCLGYRMAGFRVLWANEYHGPARESYVLNHDTPIDERDIRDVKPKDVLEALNVEPGELDVFDGSPPCQGFSTAGKREVSDTRNNLFFEYSRLLKGIKPKAFIAENVSGIVKGTMKGIFIEVLKELKSCGYRVRCKVLDAQWLGVPQMRQRVIFVGFRNDLEIEPTFPKPLAYRYSVRDALPWVGKKIVHPTGFGKRKDDSVDEPLPGIMANQGIGGSGAGQTFVKTESRRRKFTIDEIKRICSFPDDFELAGSYAQQWARLGNSVPPLMMKAIAEKVRDSLTMAPELIE